MSPNQFRAPTLARLSRKLSGSHRVAAPWGARDGDEEQALAASGLPGRSRFWPSDGQTSKLDLNSHTAWLLNRREGRAVTIHKLAVISRCALGHIRASAVRIGLVAPEDWRAWR